MLKKITLKWLLLCLLASLAANSFSAVNTILADKNFFHRDNDGRLIIQFQKPMGYISHFPAKKGKTLKITLKELFASVQPGTIISDRLIVAREGNPPFTDINYDQEGNRNGTLTIQFNQEVEYSVKSSRDRKSLSITLVNISSNKVKSSKSINSSLPAYALHLMTSSSPIDPLNQPALKNFKDYDIYVTESSKGSRTRYTLSLGYFYSLSVAKKNLKRLKPFYSSAWINKVTGKQRDIADTWFYNIRLKRLADSPKTKGKPAKIDQLMERARQAMIDKKYKQAIRLFTRIQQLGGGSVKKQTKELLGLARERNGQFAHAKAEYQEYLKLYPDGEDAERVKQRLLGLLTARSRPKQKLKKTKNNGVEPEWNFFGSLFQFYRFQRNATDTDDAITTDNSLASDIHLSGRKRGLDFNQRFDIALSNRLDFVDDRDANDGRLHSFYYDLSKRDDNYGGRIGRQTHNSDGVLGRFDGVIVNKRFSTDTKLNVLAGFPVELTTRDGVDTERKFLAVSYDMDALFLDTDFKVYALHQTNEGFTDRQAIGTQFKYIDDNTSFFATVDYDIFFSELNQATFIGTWRNKENTSISLFVDHRQSPLITTNNALIGQSVQSLSALSQTYSEDEIYQLARDRTSTYSAISVSASTQLSTEYQLSGDITASTLDGTTESGGVAATEGTDTEIYYNINLIINNLFTDSDVSILGLRYNDATTADITQLSISSNISYDRKWRISPRLIIDYRDNVNGTSRTTLKPRLLVNYRASRAWKYELDLGFEDTESEGALATQSENAFYISLGYIYDF